MIVKDLINEVVTVVAAVSGVTADDICSRKKSRKYSMPRQVCCFLAKKYFNPSWRDIAVCIYGNNDHSSVIHAYNKASDLVETDYLAGLVYARASLLLEKKFKTNGWATLKAPF